MNINGKEYKGVYALEDGWFLNQLCFSKKIFKTKESAIEIFKKLEPKREIGVVYESYIRFLWKTLLVDEYDYIGYYMPVGGFFKVDKGGKGAIDCWVIEPKQEPDEFWV